MAAAAAAARPSDQEWRRQLKHRRDLVSSDVWELLILASARHVLVDREAALPPKNQLRREVTDGIPGLADALDLRASGLPDRQLLMNWVREFGHPGTAVRDCMEASMTACQLEKVAVQEQASATTTTTTNTTTSRRTLKVSSRPVPRFSDSISNACVFSDSTRDNFIVTLVGNVTPTTLTVQYHTSSWIINSSWLNFVRSCMVVGRLFEWLDQHVAQSLGSKRTLNQAEAATLMAHEPLLELRNTFNACCIVLFHSLY
jgi:hypothetical protein